MLVLAVIVLAIILVAKTAGRQERADPWIWQLLRWQLLKLNSVIEWGKKRQ